ncbi:MAG TPA: hypothetical protein DCE02_04385 [Ruminiclostridium sp.]|jgi:hypothetical protein|uniref:Negative regulatory protein YxlE n=1 Tax=Acetivibrio saccincola TaxID=1677857 RepID=A0A2K9E3F7_9FIRM|nr:PLD nuclease N-terminal domain-containing protein [Acetivibrio saccincola]AUG57909.1 Negative regulatory protein YxlE [Acetivibrio saccincola]NLW26216.1 PLDc_N domain-containing protein [Acetivibrio saccincola]PQQ67805.1 hypothetical protein B9R14_14295 [Acetivibrio saccincola]HAA43225.1 hypothetical protein [Ruminiclostridium sp.]
MFDNMTNLEILKLFLPLIILQVGLVLYCIIDILKKGVGNLNKVLWIIIVLFVNTLGPVIYLAVGRKRWEDD